MSDPDPRHVVELLAALAFAELSSVSRVAADADTAPGLAGRIAMVDLAMARHGHVTRLICRIDELGGDAAKAMAPFVAPVQAMHTRTIARDWHERLVKASIGDAVLTDFYREVAGAVDERSRDLVSEVAAADRHEDLVAAMLRDAAKADPRLADRLSLWARRLTGDAVSSAHRVVIDRPGLAGLLSRAVDGADPVTALMARLTERSVARMSALGLAA